MKELKKGLKKFCEKFGKVSKILIPLSSSETVKGFGFVEFESSKGRDKVLKYSKKIVLLGCKINCRSIGSKSDIVFRKRKDQKKAKKKKTEKNKTSGMATSIITDLNFLMYVSRQVKEFEESLQEDFPLLSAIDCKKIPQPKCFPKRKEETLYKELFEKLSKPPRKKKKLNPRIQDLTSKISHLKKSVLPVPLPLPPPPLAPHLSLNNSVPPPPIFPERQKMPVIQHMSTPQSLEMSPTTSDFATRSFQGDSDSEANLQPQNAIYGPDPSYRSSEKKLQIETSHIVPTYSHSYERQLPKQHKYGRSPVHYLIRDSPSNIYNREYSRPFTEVDRDRTYEQIRIYDYSERDFRTSQYNQSQDPYADFRT